jgi:hypothetical protein
MKKMIQVIIAVAVAYALSSTAFASPDQYNLSFGGNPSWGAGTNFWEHNYWTPGACPNGATHTGRDTHTESNANRKLNKIRSYGFGQVSGIVLGATCINTNRTRNIVGSNGSLSSLSIKHLLDSGETVQTNLLHGAFLDSILTNSYLAKGQYLGTEDNRASGVVNRTTGAVSSCLATHLHTEIASTTSLAWICTANAIPSANGNTLPDAKYSKDELTGHYDRNNLSRIYYSPDDTFNNHSELLPWLSNNSNNTTPSSANFDVYGVVNQSLYGQMVLKRTNAKDFKAIGILMKNGSKRDGFTDIATANGKWLAATWANPTVNDFNSNAVYPVSVSGVSYPVSGNYKYTAVGDYVAIPFITKDGIELLKGYPVIFSILPNADSRIIDNDKPTDATNATVSYYVKPAATETEPGYFLTSDVAKAKSNAVGKWLPNVAGNYQVSVFIPKSTNSKVIYKIKEQGTNSVAKLACVNQNNANGSWAPLVVNTGEDKNKDGKVDILDFTCPAGGDATTPTTFTFTNAGLVAISLNSTSTALGDNPHLTASDKVVFDAVKFEVPSSGSVALTGKTIGYQYHWPSITENWSGASNGNFVVGSGVEILNIAENWGTINIFDSNILVDFTGASGWVSGSFNGFEIFDALNGIGDFKSVTINPATNMAGFDSSRITFDANHIWVNWQGLSFDANTVVSLDINK